MKHTLLILIAVFGLYSCSNNDYLVDGGVADPNVKTTTFEYLKSHKQLDTLALLIERADMINVVNAKSTTLFAPNNLSIRNYVAEMIFEKRKTNPTATFTIDDIPVASLKVMLGNYVFDQTIDRSNMLKQGKIYTTHSGEERLISLQPVDAYNAQLDYFPEYVYYTFKVGATWDPIEKAVDDKKTVVRTSNLISTNGVIHVLQGDHIFSNYIRIP